MDYQKTIERVYEHLENDAIGKAVMACLRIARHLRDYLNACIFLRELYPEDEAFRRIFQQDLSHLKADTQELLRNRSSAEFFLTHTVPFSFESKKPEQVTVIREGIDVLDQEAIQLEGTIADLTIPSGMHPLDTAQMFDESAAQKLRLRMRIKAITLVRSRVKTRCLNYAITVEKQVEAQNKAEVFLHAIQAEVNNYFRAHCEDVYIKLHKATQLVDSVNPEDCSLLLTEIRRSIKAVADYFGPVPDPAITTCQDGVERKLGEEQYLNRLHEYLSRQVHSTGSSGDLFQAEVNVLMTFARKLDRVSSKGVHSEVSSNEAKQGLLGLYMLLYNVIAKLQNVESMAVRLGN